MVDCFSRRRLKWMENGMKAAQEDFAAEIIDDTPD
jgi:hypothetical protein